MMGSVFIAGKPATKGSFRAVAKGVVVSDCKRTKPWQREISAAIRCVASEPLTGAVKLELEFRFHRPKSHFVNGDGQRLKADVTHNHASKPDVDKLTRAAMDGLTGALYVDDSQVTVAHVAKVYLPTRDDDEGVLIRWDVLDDAEAQPEPQAALSEPAVAKPRKDPQSSLGLSADDEAMVVALIADLREQLPDQRLWPDAKLRLVALMNLGLLPKG